MKKFVITTLLSILTLFTFTNSFANCTEGDCKNGFGTATDQQGGGTYSGNWRNGLYHGKGTLSWSEGSQYVGEWKDGQKDGYGLMHWATLKEKYDGMWEGGFFIGQGTFTHSDGKVESGEWVLNEDNILDYSELK